MKSLLQAGELDALTEIAHIGMGHAATALSQLMNKGVEIAVPRLQMLDRSGVAELLDSQQIELLHLQILGNVRGTLLILLPEQNARRMLELLLGKATPAALPLSELEVSTLMEVGNILASACLNALGGMLKMTLLPSVPALSSGSAGELLARLAHPDTEGEAAVMIDTVFSVAESVCGGSIFLIPAPGSLAPILRALGAR
jgi:chemotaxis protein CheC